MANKSREHTLFRLFGLPIKVSPSWFVLLTLIVVSLAVGYFPAQIGSQGPWQLYWGLAAVGAVGLFASLIVHEMCHSLVARATGMPVAGITLFIFGGVSQLEDEPRTPLSEFVMAIVGPLSSFLIGLGLMAAWFTGGFADWPAAVQALLKYLWIINLALAAFNSLPAFPLDGGRVLRSVVWTITQDLTLATRIAAKVGSVFGILLILLGAFIVLNSPGIPLGGIWFVIIGFFVRRAATGSVQMVLMREHLAGRTVAELMTHQPVTVPRDMSLREFVDEVVFRYRFSHYPVVDGDGRFAGLVSARAPRRVDSRRWPYVSVGQVALPPDQSLKLRPDRDAVSALSALSDPEGGPAVVLRLRMPVGVLTQGDVLDFLALSKDLRSTV